jgi:hypothetical protein
LYKNYNILSSDEILAFIDVDNSEKIGVYIKKDVILPLKEIEKNNLIIQYDMVDKLYLPIKKDQEVGFVKIYYQNKIIFIESKGKENDVFYIKKKMFRHLLETKYKNKELNLFPMYFEVYTKKQLLQAINIIKQYDDCR